MVDHLGTEPCIALSFEIGSCDKDVRNALTQITSGLSELGIETEPRGLIELVVAEALNNIVEHAYGKDREGRIGLRLHADSSYVTLVIRDCGAPMPDGALPVGAAPDLAVACADLPEGGFGWFLIRKLADRLVYRRKNGQNKLEIGMAVSVASNRPIT